MQRDEESRAGKAPSEQGKDEAVRDKARNAYLKWYKANRAAFNRNRKALYSQDAERRLAIIERQRQYRKDNPAPTPRRKTLTDRQGRVQEVYRMGEMATIIKRDEQTIRIWEKRGYIPETTIPSPHRYYTSKQVLLLAEFSDLMRGLHYDAQARDRLQPAKSLEIASNWEE